MLESKVEVEESWKFQVLPSLENIRVAQHFDIAGAIISMFCVHIGAPKMKDEKETLLNNILVFFIGKFLEKTLESRNRNSHAYYQTKLGFYALEKALYLLFPGYLILTSNTEQRKAPGSYFGNFTLVVVEI